MEWAVAVHLCLKKMVPKSTKKSDVENEWVMNFLVKKKNDQKRKTVDDFLPRQRGGERKILKSAPVSTKVRGRRLWKDLKTQKIWGLVSPETKMVWEKKNWTVSPVAKLNSDNFRYPSISLVKKTTWRTDLLSHPSLSSVYRGRGAHRHGEYRMSVGYFTYQTNEVDGIARWVHRGRRRSLAGPPFSHNKDTRKTKKKTGVLWNTSWSCAKQPSAAYTLIEWESYTAPCWTGVYAICGWWDRIIGCPAARLRPMYTIAPMTTSPWCAQSTQ